MLVAVFGAGASYDSIPSRPPVSFPPEVLPDRPPLANELFADRPRFIEAMSSFPKCQPIVPYLRHLRTGDSLERVLERLQAEGHRYPERHKQLAAVRYYLHFMLWECQRHWNEVARGVTNYKTLLDQIERWREPGESVCLVTFNYDTMIEEALPSVGVEIRQIHDYIASDKYKLIKLHGSVNWAREVATPIDNIEAKNAWQVAYELIERILEIGITANYRVATEHPIGRAGRTPLFPAIAIPVETKHSYECPPEHLEVLYAAIREVSRLLLIGWRGTEVPFLQLLSGNVPRQMPVMIVAGTRGAAEEVAHTLQSRKIMGRFLPLEGGFTHLVVARAADEFLSTRAS